MINNIQNINIDYRTINGKKILYTGGKTRIYNNENLIAEYNEKKLQEDKNTDTTTKGPSFKGLGKAVEYFAFSPVRNMWILDGAITGERLKDSRSPQEFIGYSIKEASTLLFMYYAGGKIQELLEKKAKELNKMKEKIFHINVIL